MWGYLFVHNVCLLTYQVIKQHCIFTELTLNPPEGIIAGPVNEENFFEWEALITYVYIIFSLLYVYDLKLGQI